MLWITLLKGPLNGSKNGRGFRERRYIPEVHKPVYYVCGPPEMVTAMQKLLYSLRVNEDNIRSEEFGGY